MSSRSIRLKEPITSSTLMNTLRLSLRVRITKMIRVSKHITRESSKSIYLLKKEILKIR